MDDHVDTHFRLYADIPTHKTDTFSTKVQRMVIYKIHLINLRGKHKPCQMCNL